MQLSRAVYATVLFVAFSFLSNLDKLPATLSSNDAAEVEVDETEETPKVVSASHAPAGISLAELETHYMSQAHAVDYGDAIVDLAPQFRQRNRASSCVHATTVMLLRWQGMYEMADWWWNNYRGGESAGPHERKMKEAGLKYVMTDDGDESLLKWGLDTRRGVGVTWGGAHCVMLAGKTKDGYAVILDNNQIGKFKYEPWDEFLRNWRRCGAWAFVICSGKIPPPVPTR